MINHDIGTCQGHVPITVVYLLSVGGFKFLKETDIVFREQTEVVNLIFEVGDAFDTHSECKT